MAATHELSLPHPEGSQSDRQREQVPAVVLGSGSAVVDLGVIIRLSYTALSSPNCTSFTFLKPGNLYHRGSLLHGADSSGRG